MDDVFISCEHCSHRFEAGGHLAGGLVNCPSCGRATEVPGGVDTLWNVVVAAVFAGTVVVVVIAYMGGGWTAALMALGVCSMVGLIARLSS